MRNILRALALGFGLVTAYMLFSSLTFMLAGERRGLLPYLDLPVRAPKAVFFYLSPPRAEDFSPAFSRRKLSLTVIFYLVNVLLYSVPAYIFIRLVARGRRGFEPKRAGPPPPPAPLN